MSERLIALDDFIRGMDARYDVSLNPGEWELHAKTCPAARVPTKAFRCRCGGRPAMTPSVPGKAKERE